MSKKLSAFARAVSSICSAARRRIGKKGTVSAVDLSSIAPTITGGTRGAAVRTAFRTLEDEKVMCRTADTVYNPNTRHRVCVYKSA